MKKILTICLSLMLAGGALVALGAATGADETVKWSRDGFASAAATQKTVANEGKLTFDRLNLSAGSAEVRIVSGAEPGYILENVAEEDYSVKLENGELVIETGAGVSFSLFPFADMLSDRRTRVTVTVPASLASLTAAVASGDLRVADVSAGDLVVTVASGKMDVERVTADSAVMTCASGDISVGKMTAAERMTISVSSGRIDAKDIVSAGLTAQVSSGGMSISGDLRGDTSIRVTSGDAALSFAAPIGEYRRSVSVSSGDVYVNGVKNPGNDTNSAAKNSLSASITSGSLRLDFAE